MVEPRPFDGLSAKSNKKHARRLRNSSISPMIGIVFASLTTVGSERQNELSAWSRTGTLAMAVETKLTLEHDTIEKLQDLIELNLDSYNALVDAADRAEDKQVAGLFRELAAQRSSQAAELKGLVNANGEEPHTEGSFASKARRAWLNFKSFLPGAGTSALLAEAERGEDQLQGAYEDALRDIAGSAVTDVLNRHVRNVKAAHDRVKMLRDQAETS
jgi:uncharacterized protein (TIGR02284 family)